MRDYVISIIGCTILFIFLVYSFFAYTHKQTVRKLSSKLPQVAILNSSYSFQVYDELIKLRHYCKSKREFDRCESFDVLMSEISENLLYYKSLVSTVERNNLIYYRYLEKYNGILASNADIDLKNYKRYKYFEKVEQKECDSMILQPALSLDAKVEISYCSPKGRHFYHEEYDFPFDSIKEAIRKIEETNKHRESSVYQRRLMTDSLRYDILRRDGFRCVICGATASDGVKLHVDHIVPISKGGKTERNNLRTLCAQCNMGKSAKYHPEGYN